MRRIVLAFALACTGSGCRTPTAILTELSTDEGCALTQGTTITVGEAGDIETKSVVASTRACDAAGTVHRIGSLALVPADDDSAPFAVKVVLGVHRPAEACSAPDYNGCIVARRALSFIPHTELELP